MRACSICEWCEIADMTCRGGTPDAAEELDAEGKVIGIVPVWPPATPDQWCRHFQVDVQRMATMAAAASQPEADEYGSKNPPTVES